ncbi:MAG: FHA domain-containing protein [Actinobacteria bacterium]|nr:FHA domain-containing protein [Actinomycetota bacterium]MCB9388611.1 FHA domain-containing protein [Acidimicrobiia bacterium]
MFCHQCGQQLPEGSRFCSACGVQLDLLYGVGTSVDELHTGQDVPAVDDLEPGTAVVVVERGPNAGSRYLVDQDVTQIGRHSESDILLDDITVSRHHARLTRTRTGEFVVHDIGSLNGTYVNRRRVEDAVVRTGDELQVGRFKLVLFIAGE